jgi:hypothetical protein
MGAGFLGLCLALGFSVVGRYWVLRLGLELNWLSSKEMASFSVLQCLKLGGRSDTGNAFLSASLNASFLVLKPGPVVSHLASLAFVKL